MFIRHLTATSARPSAARRRGYGIRTQRLRMPSWELSPTIELCGFCLSIPFGSCLCLCEETYLCRRQWDERRASVYRRSLTMRGIFISRLKQHLLPVQKHVDEILFCRKSEGWQSNSLRRCLSHKLGGARLKSVRSCCMRDAIPAAFEYRMVGMTSFHTPCHFIVDMSITYLNFTSPAATLR